LNILGKFSLYNFNIKNNKSISDESLLNKIDFCVKNNKSNISLIQNGKTVIGTYIRVYKYNKGINIIIIYFIFRY